VRWRSILPFIAIAFGFSWSIAIPLYISESPKTIMPIIASLYMLGPLVATVALMLIRRDLSWKDIGVRFNINGWWIVGWLFPAVFILLTIAVSLLMPGVEFSPDLSGFLERLSKYASPQEVEAARSRLSLLSGHLAAVYFLIAMVVGATVNAVFAFGEEAGWRGFLYRELRGWGFWRMSLFVGIVWGLWHAPLILKGHNYPEHPVVGILMMSIFTTLLSPILFFLRERSGSVIVPSIAHGTLNALGGLAIMYVRGGSDLIVGATGISGMLVLLMFNLLIYLLVKES